MEESDINISGNYSTLWHESLVLNHTNVDIVPDLDGDDNPDVLVYTERYNSSTNEETVKLIAKKGSDGTHLWEESVNASGENNCDISAVLVRDLDGDGLNDTVIIESVYDEWRGTETKKAIAKKGNDGTLLWEESVSGISCFIEALPARDLDGDGLQDVLISKVKYDIWTEEETAKAMAKKGKDGTVLWEESVSAGVEDDCNISASSVGDLDGDDLGDVVVAEIKYDKMTETVTIKLIAKKGKDGTLLWEESETTSGVYTFGIDAEVGDLDGDGWDDIIIGKWKYNETTNTTTVNVIAKAGKEGTHLWEEAVNESGADNCDFFAEWAGDIDGDGLADVIMGEWKYNETINTTTSKVIAKKGKDGTPFWEESVSESGKDNCFILHIMLAIWMAIFLMTLSSPNGNITKQPIPRQQK